jgi:hypothetical protein
MTPDEIMQQKKNEVLNNIRKIYHPKYKFHYDHYSGESYSEQRESHIRYMIDKLEEELNKIKNQKRAKNEHNPN